jgi:DmsE family decaheme c-type cytochrome
MKSLNVNFKYATLFTVGLVVSLVAVKPAYPEGKFKLRPGAKGRICLKCHETFKQVLSRRFVHPLLKKGECTGCHVPHTSSHKNLLTASTTKLCQSCHTEVLPEKARSTHPVVVEGNCNKCHDSHGSNNKAILLKSGSELCFGCHQDLGDTVGNLRFRHKSVEQGKGCLNCHNPHASAKSDDLLRTAVPTLCKKCHKTNRLTFKTTHMNYPVAGSDCTACHNPHGSNKRGMIFDVAHADVVRRKCATCHQKAPSLETKQPPSQLCRECHKTMANQTFTKDRVHWPLVDSVSCLHCHGPHATKEQKLLKGPQLEVCGECHADTVELQEVSKKNPKNERLCEPVKTGKCTTCHSPHAADKVLLVNEASMSFDICGRCHQWETHSTHPIGEKVIDPRDKNLTVECLSCHRGCGTGNNPSMLTFSSTYELCIQCHVERRK